MTHPSEEFLALQSALAGEYSLQRELGRGGMGVVYLARDVQLDRDVAIKVLPADLARDSVARERFLREARMAAGLSHPNIVPIHRVSQVGGFVFFVMSYIEGETLGERLRTRGPLAPADAARVLREVAWALAYAHGRGIVHRDVKPDNILLEARTGRALVTDFGIAQGNADVAVTDPGKVMGTLQFMSPEQAAGETIDGRSDIYALGVVGFLAVSGRLPSVMDREDSVSVTRVAPGLPPALATAIDRCLALDPSERFADGEQLAEALAPDETRPTLPTTLRAWLAARNPLILPYAAWSAGFSVLTAGNIYANLTGNPGSSWWDVALLAAVASSPLLPIIGFHLNQARRQFRAGHSLADLRTALEIARRERAETEAVVQEAAEPAGIRVLRDATVASVTWLGVTALLLLQGVIHEKRMSIWWMITPMMTTLLLGAVSNALDVQFIPTKLREWWQTGIRDRLWNSRAGEWLARRLGAPQRSRVIGAGVFRPTEAALGLAASELFAALPSEYREQVPELPAIVATLEARAAEARARIDELNVMSPSASAGADVLAERRKKAQSQLAESVAALEGIRLDLLRLHAGAGDLAPLTTLMDAARAIGEDLSRLAEAQQEVERAAGRRLPADRAPTPV